MSNFTTFDIICAVLILIFTARCAIRGFISELMSMAAIVLGLLASLYFFKKGGEYVCARFMPDHRTIADILAFVLLFVIVFLVIKILEHLLKGIIEGIKLGKADRFLGIIFGFLEGIIVVSLVLFVISVQPLFDPLLVLNNSFFAGILLPLITGARETAVDATVLIIPRITGASGNV
jgi:membrane protein required for colicin V production